MFTKSNHLSLYLAERGDTLSKQMLVHQINNFQKTGKGANDLLLQFKPLLIKYATLLQYPDAYNELQSYFLTLLFTIDLSKLSMPKDPVIIRYIQRAIKHYYCKKAKEIQREQSFIEHNEKILIDIIDMEDHYSTLIDSIALEQALEQLSEKQRTIISLFYFNGVTIKEIAKQLGVSRQATNQCRIRALHMLKQLMTQQ